MNCLRTHFNYGYTSSPVFDETPIPFTASIWNFLFVLTVNIILTAIISGIIIDTFGERREMKKNILEDN